MQSSNDYSINETLPSNLNEPQIYYLPLKKILSKNYFDDLPPIFELSKFLAPVCAFEHAPFKNEWNDLFKGNLMVDVLTNKHDNPNDNEYWRALIHSGHGYFISILWLGLSNQSNSKSMVNFRIYNLLPVMKNNGNLITRTYRPPNFLKNASPKEMYKVSSTFPTLKKDLYILFKEFLNKKLELEYDLVFESIDQSNPSKMLCCQIQDKFGDWLLIRYEAGDSKKYLNHETHWVHPKSGLIRVTGWSRMIGYPILTTKIYSELSLSILMKNSLIQENYLMNTDLFPLEPNIDNNFRIGDYLEFLDPLWHKMVIVKVSEKLKQGFMKLEYLDFGNPNSKIRKIFQHVTSRLLFPIGYSSRNNIPLNIDQDLLFCPKLMPNVKNIIHKNAADISCFPPIPMNNMNFLVGHVVETFNLIAKGVIAYAIINRIVDRLLSLKFISHDPYLEIWVEYQSYHLRPFGFTNLLDLTKHIESPIYMENASFGDLERRFVLFRKTLISKKLMDPVN